MDVDNYSYDYEERKYLDPTVSRGEQLDFINTFRNIQDQNNAQINEQTHNLGRDLPSNLGGLSGSEGYFQSRYQTPQVNTMVANLNAAAQASALNQVLNNLQSQYKQSYTKAQQNYQSRANMGNSGNTTTPTTTDGSLNTDPEVEIETTPTGTAYGGEGAGQIRTSAPGTTVITNGSRNSEGKPGYNVYNYEGGQPIGGSNYNDNVVNNTESMDWWERILANTTGIPGLLYTGYQGLVNGRW